MCAMQLVARTSMYASIMLYLARTNMQHGHMTLGDWTMEAMKRERAQDSATTSSALGRPDTVGRVRNERPDSDSDDEVREKKEGAGRGGCTGRKGGLCTSGMNSNSHSLVTKQLNGYKFRPLRSWYASDIGGAP